MPRVSFQKGTLAVQMSRLRMTNDHLRDWCEWIPRVLTELITQTGTRRDVCVNVPNDNICVRPFLRRLTLFRILTGKLKNTQLDFSHNFITDAGLQMIMQVFIKHEIHVADLNLNDNQLTDACLRDIGEYVTRFEQPISVLGLEGNKFTTKGIIFLACKIKGHPGYPRYDI